MQYAKSKLVQTMFAQYVYIGTSLFSDYNAKRLGAAVAYKRIVEQKCTLQVALIARCIATSFRESRTEITCDH